MPCPGRVACELRPFLRAPLRSADNQPTVIHRMTRTAAALSMLCCLGWSHAQDTDTYVLHKAVSNRETIVYRRVIRFDDQTHLFHVQDYYEDGHIQMDAFYSSFDKRVKEEYQCNYRSNTKEGPYKEWHRNGRRRFDGHFTRGVRFDDGARLVVDALEPVGHGHRRRRGDAATRQ